MTNGSKLLKQFFNSNNFKGSFQSCKNISPKSNLIECCFIGRSNVGKSSIINAITKTKNLAKISNTPGRTQSINIFEINKCINLVDLPGYGFAKVSKVMRYDLSILIEDYIKNRSNLEHAYVLIDAKVGPKSLDIDMFDFLAEYNRLFSIVITKVDKCSKLHLEVLEKSINSLMESYSGVFEKIFLSSTKKKQGIIDIQKDIYQLSKKNEI